VTHWSTQLLAGELGFGDVTIARASYGGDRLNTAKIWIKNGFYLVSARLNRLVAVQRRLRKNTRGVSLHDLEHILAHQGRVDVSATGTITLLT
jgi:hypothetical protein